MDSGLIWILQCMDYAREFSLQFLPQLVAGIILLGVVQKTLRRELRERRKEEVQHEIVGKLVAIEHAMSKTILQLTALKNSAEHIVRTAESAKIFEENMKDIKGTGFLSLGDITQRTIPELMLEIEVDISTYFPGMRSDESISEFMGSIREFNIPFVQMVSEGIVDLDSVISDVDSRRQATRKLIERLRSKMEYWANR